MFQPVRSTKDASEEDEGLRSISNLEMIRKREYGTASFT